MSDTSLGHVDVTQCLKDAENSLRDFIVAILAKEFGDEWTSKCGVTADRVEKWEERKAAEAGRQAGGSVEPRILYYADFYDLKTILEKRWDKFADALGDLKTMRVFLAELEKLRDPDAHRRELLPHQKHLAMGIAGEIRTRLVRYRSKLDSADDYFPKIESARDSLGNVWTPMEALQSLMTGNILRPRDQIDFVVTATDPKGEALRYRLVSNYVGNGDWQDSNVLSATIGTKDVGRSFALTVQVQSNREDHARPGGVDDQVEFFYSVLPAHQ